MDVKLEFIWMILSLQLIITNCIPYTQQLGKGCSTTPNSNVTVSDATACKQTCDYNSQCKAAVYMSTIKQCSIHSSCPSPFTSSPDKDIYMKETVFQCDFEVDTCSMTQDIADYFDWTRQNRSTPSYDTGPTGGQLGSLYYMYIEATSKGAGYKARLVTPAIQYIGTVCIQFGVHMYGYTINELQIFKQTGNTYGTNVQVLAFLKNDQGNEWRKSQVNVTLTSLEDRIGFTGIIGSSFTGDIAIDNIVITKGSFGMCDTVDCGMEQPYSSKVNITYGMSSAVGASATYSCHTGHTFLSGDVNRVCQSNGHWSGAEILCGDLFECDSERTFGPFLQYTSNQFNWYWSISPKILPYTILKGQGGSSRYLYSSLSASLSNGSEGSIETLSLRYSGQVCVQFWLHMYGDSINEFRVFRLNRVISTSAQVNVLTKTGSQGNEWRRIQLIVTLSSIYDRIRFTAVAGPSYVGVIAIDSLRITATSHRLCDAPVDCGKEPAYDPRVNITFNDSSVGGVATYFCNEGHTFAAGNTTRICQSNGYWSGSEIICGDLLECDSELTNCDFIQDSSDQFNWYKSSYPKILPGMTLKGQGGSRSYWYSSFSASYSNGSEGRMLTPSLKYSGHVCVQFWLHMYGDGINEFRVYRQNGVSYTSRVNVLTKTGSQGNEWRKIHLMVTTSSTFDKIGFTAVAGPTYVGPFAIDSLRITAAPNGLCPVDCGKEPAYDPRVNITFNDSSVGGVATYFCNEGHTFAAGNTTRICQSDGYWSGSEIICGDLLECDSELTNCDFIQDSSDQFNWYKSSYPKILPGMTLKGQGGSRSYWYSSFSASYSNGSEGRMLTPSLKYSGHVCVQFWLHMYGDGINEFRVYRQNGVSYTSHVNVLTKTGSQGNEWRKIHLMVTTSSTFDKIGFTAVAGPTYVGLFAIDSLRITAAPNGLCPVDCGKEPPYSPHVNITINNSSVGGVATYFCTEGHTFVEGNTTRVCQSDGYWSGSEIICGDLLECDSELTNCNFIQDSNDQFNWNKSSNPKTLPGTTLKGQGGSRSYWYSSFSASYSNGSEGRMLTQSLKYLGHVCVQFWLHMYGDGINEFRVYRQNGVSYSSHVDVLTKTGSQGNEWRKIQLMVTTSRTFDKIGFTAVAGPTYVGLFAIDSLRITAAANGLCPVDCGKEPPYSPHVNITITNSSVGGVATYFCNEGHTFVEGNTTRVCQSDGYWSGSEIICGALLKCNLDYDSCVLTQDYTDHFNWYEANWPIIIKSTQISGQNKTSRFWYASQAFRNKGDEARMTTSNLFYIGDVCIQFWLHMFTDMNELRVYKQTGLDYTTHNDILNITGSQGNEWRRIQFKATLTSANDRIGFTAVANSTNTGYIAIDSILITAAIQGHCDTVNCGNEEPSYNPTVTIDYGNSSTVGAKAQYSCVPGLIYLHGEMNRTCQSDGYWSGDVDAVKCGRIGNWTSWRDVSPCDYTIREKNQTRFCENGTCLGDVNRTASCYYPNLSSIQVSGLVEVRLVNHTIKNFTTPMVTSCVLKCRMDVQCYSVNYRTLKGDEGLCEINSQAPTNTTLLQKYMVYHPGSNYYPIKQSIDYT